MKVDCDCGASLSPTALLQLDWRCPECSRYWEPCPSCGEWVAPFGGYDPFEFCPHCGLDGSVKSDLRMGRRTLREVRQDAAVPQFQPVDGSTADPEIEYSDDGEVSV